MTLGATLLASLLVTLARPSTWALTLLAFLARGGVLVVVLPIVTVPSTVGLANLVAPTITDAWLNGATAPVLIALGGIVLGALVAILIGSVVAAVAEVEAIRIVAADEDVAALVWPEPAPTEERRPWRVVASVVIARWIALAPLLLAVGMASVRLVAVTYRELTVPSAGNQPLVIRVLAAAPDAVALLAVTWILGEIVGDLATRRVVQAGDGPLRGVVRGALAGLRRPWRAAVLYVVPALGLVLVATPSAAATGMAWTAVRVALTEVDAIVIAILAIGLLVGLWAAWLVLLGVVTAWRTAAWTVEAAGTFGGGQRRRPGGSLAPVASGTLSDLRPRGADPDPR
jgi:hypothetical protein